MEEHEIKVEEVRHTKLKGHSSEQHQEHRLEEAEEEEEVVGVG